MMKTTLSGQKITRSGETLRAELAMLHACDIIRTARTQQYLQQQSAIQAIRYHFNY